MLKLDNSILGDALFMCQTVDLIQATIVGRIYFALHFIDNLNRM